MEINSLLASETTVDVDLKLRLNKVDYERVCGTGQELPRVAAYLIENYSKGGVMLRPTHTHYLEQISGTPVKTPESVMQICESAVTKGSGNGSLMVSYTVDPALSQPLEQLAFAQGRSPTEIVQDGINTVLTNSWLYGLQTTGGTVFLTEEDRKRLEKALNKKSITGRDLADWADRKGEEQQVKKVGKLRAEVLARMGHAQEEA